MATEDPTKKQIEEVDPEVAEILGLGDNFDLDYDEYFQLLREAMVKGAMDEKSKLSEENLAKLANERKRVKGFKGSKFTPPKKTVNTGSFFNKKPQGQGATQKPITNPAKLLPGSGGAIQKYEPPEPEEKEDKTKKLEDFLNGTLLGIVKEIRGLTEDILSVLQKQSAADKKGSELSRREGEKSGKKSKEKDLEAKEEKKGLGLVEKITKPFTSIFDTIKNFIMMVLLGSLANWLFSVLQNPMILLKPIQGLIDGIAGFFNTILQFLDNMVVQPVRNFIDAINSALNSFISLLNSALKMLPGSPQIGPANLPNIPEPPEIQGPDITGERKQEPVKSGPPINLRFTGGSITPPTQKEKKQFSFDDKVSREGGNVSSDTTAFDVSGLGPDKHLTALSNGEYVLKKGAADWLGGAAYLDNINKMFGGTTERRVANLGDVKIQAAATGGEIGGSSKSSSIPPPVGTVKVGSKVFKPADYFNNRNTVNSHYVEAGKPLKSYVLKYTQDGSNYIIKQINKAATRDWRSFFTGGMTDGLRGIDPASPEGLSVINSANTKEYFQNQFKLSKINMMEKEPTAEELKKVKIIAHPESSIAYWFNQAYVSSFNDYIKTKSRKDARIAASKNAAAFVIRKLGKSLRPGEKGGAPEEYNQQAVDADISSPSGPSGSEPPSSEGLQISEAAHSFRLRGDPGIDTPSVQPTTPMIFGSQSRNPTTEKNEPGVVASKTATPIAQSPVKPNIPQPPQTQSSITTLPLPSMKNGGQKQSGMTKNGTTPTVVFSSFNVNESSIVTTASLYNIWGM